ncbi:MAG: redox-sensing transcriptional repressor Rex [Bacteroidota bacterium]|nr:redox-sensing transcriptional repressor Rex [Bacteroidota bacterium]
MEPVSPPPKADKNISKATFRRLPHYHQIASTYEGIGRKYISSKELSQILQINETLVRKDMADLEIRGRQNLGYEIQTMRKMIEDYLGLQEITEALIVGAGHLGKALALYHGFEPYGLRIVGLLDNDPEKIGTSVGPYEVLSVFRLASIVERHRIKLIILTVPKSAAQEVTDIAVAAGVRAVWNFTPTELRVPEGVYVRNEQIIAGFMTLSYFLKSISENEGAGK